MRCNRNFSALLSNLAADGLVSAVEVFHILEVEVARRDVSAAAEPPRTSVRLKVPIRRSFDAGKAL